MKIKLIEDIIGNTLQEELENTDGWDCSLVNEVLIPYLDDIETFAYEIRNAVRGSYAKFGNTVEDLVKELEEQRNELDDIIAAFEDQTDSLNEELDDEDMDVDIPLPIPGPDTQEARGMSDLLLALINDENEAIMGYNSFLATLEQYEGYEDFIPVVNDINAEEMNHIGMLQNLLKKLSPNAANIDAGEEEAQELLEEGLFGDYNPYDGWKPEDIEKHKEIDWAARNYEEFEDDSEEFIAPVVAYGVSDNPIEKKVIMHKFIRANPIYPPYYKAVEVPFENVVGPMYDGNTRGEYDIHDRYETQELYDRLSV